MLHRYPTTVTLVADPDGATKMMFCLNCQSPFTQYTGDIVTIMPGDPPLEAFTLTRCRNSRCPMVYSVMGIVQMPKYYYL